MKLIAQHATQCVTHCVSQYVSHFLNMPGRLGLLALLLPMALAFVLPSPTEARVLERFGSLQDVQLESAGDVLVSPDGRFVYVSVGLEGVLFERDASNGKLTYRDTVDRGESLGITPDGRWFYSAWSGLRVHSRSVATGRVSLVEAWDNAAYFDFGLPEDLWIGPDAQQVYAASYDSLVVFDRNPANGTLDVTQRIFSSVDGIEGTKDLAFSGDGRFLYVTSRDFGGPDSLAIFRRGDDGQLTFQQAMTSSDAGFEALVEPHSVRITQDGRSLYVAGTQGLLVLERDPADGTVAPVEALGTESQALGTSPDDRFVYLFRSDWVEVYERSAGGSTLNLVETFQVDVEELGFVGDVDISPDGRQLYISTLNGGNLRAGIAVLSRNPATGTLGLIEAHLRDVEGDAEGIENAEAMAVSPDGRHVYTGASNTFGLEVGAFSRAPDTGELEFLDSYGDWLSSANQTTVRAIAVSPDGQNVYLIYRDLIYSVRLLALSRNPDSGKLDFVQDLTHGVDDVDGLSFAEALVVSPDGRHVYVTGSFEGTVAVYERDASTGELAPLHVYYDGVDGFEGLGGADDLVITSSGDFLYVAATDDAALTVLKRDASTGELGEVQSYTYGFFSDLALSPDERNLYAGRGRMWVFSRDAATGRITELETHNDFIGDPYVTADGKYVVGFGEDASVYRRDAATGRLKLIEREELAYGFRAQTAAQSPDGENFYTAGTDYRFDSLFQFRRNEGPCREVWDGLCLGDDRFLVDLEWRDFDGNTGKGKPVLSGADDSAILWFFGPENWEMQLKVLDACGLNDRFWVFAAATTNVEYTLSVTDVVTGATKSYFNPLGNAASAITDTDVFSCAGVAGESTQTLADRAPAVGAPAADAPAHGSPVVRTAYRQASLEKVNRPGLMKGLGDKCLDVENGDRTDGSPVVLYDCHGDENQRWGIGQICPYHCTSDFELQVYEDQCLVPGPDTGGNFQQLVIGACNTAESQWESSGLFPKEFSMIHSETGLCVDVLGSSTDNRTPVGLFECHGGENQQWEFESFDCSESPVGACKAFNRFTIEVEWRDFDGNVGKGRVVPQESLESGLFWFFGPDNWEMLVKVLTGCELNEHFWVFAAATTNVEYTLRVTDALNGEVREYFNPLGNAAPSITDTSAFTCVP